MAKKIMFSDKYGLIQAVLEGRKTQTRRKIPLTPEDEEYLSTAFDWELRESVIIERYARYKVGEEVAIAQKYSELEYGLDWVREQINKESAGWNNKMFVKAELMPHRIKITNIRVERLQDISDEDCLKEGIMHGEFVNTWDEYYFEHGCNYITAKTPCEAYKKLINRISGKGTWESNPWVFVYDFELVK